MKHMNTPPTSFRLRLQLHAHVTNPYTFNLTKNTKIAASMSSSAVNLVQYGNFLLPVPYKKKWDNYEGVRMPDDNGWNYLYSDNVFQTQWLTSTQFNSQNPFKGYWVIQNMKGSRITSALTYFSTGHNVVGKRYKVVWSGYTNPDDLPNFSTHGFMRLCLGSSLSQGALSQNIIVEHNSSFEKETIEGVFPSNTPLQFMCTNGAFEGSDYANSRIVSRILLFSVEIY